MRIVIAGASALAVATGKVLLERGHELVIVEPDAARVRALGDEVDCGLLQGDGSRPSVLKEVGPAKTDWLLALGDDDRANILAALVGRELAFRQVVAKIEDPEYEKICTHLGLENTIVPDLEIGLSLADMVEARGNARRSTRLPDGLRFLTFTVDARRASTVAALDLPAEARVVAVTRGSDARLADGETELRTGDRVLLVVHAKHAALVSKHLSAAKPEAKRDADS